MRYENRHLRYNKLIRLTREGTVKHKKLPVVKDSFIQT